MRTKPSHELTLPDRLSHLSPNEALLLLGANGRKLLAEGGMVEIAIDTDVHLDDRLLLVNVRGKDVRLELDKAGKHGIAFGCECGPEPCLHRAAVLALVLEEKTTLGLAQAPSEELPLERLSEALLVERELEERVQRAKEERMSIEASDATRPWSDYVVTNKASGKSYRVALRGTERGASYCSCPDFRKNALGTCKHILKVQDRVHRKFDARTLARPYVRTRTSVALAYGDQVGLRVTLPDARDRVVTELLGSFAGAKHVDPRKLAPAIRSAIDQGIDVHVYPDAQEYLEQSLMQDRLDQVCKRLERQGEKRALGRPLLAVELLPYQRAGVAFLVRAGRAILADDMGLGKTIQAIAAAELLAREAGITRVLVVCPASVKAQWRSEIERFCARSVQIVAGTTKARVHGYRNDAFFTICNYEQVLRDLLTIENVPWDLIVVDEAQRIKNWESKTARVLKALRSRYAIALTGTPLENRLEELYSVVEFVDDRRLGAMSRFFHRHRLVDDTGRVLGYTNLEALRANLAPVLLRRTRAAVLQELPPRTVEIVRVPASDEQLGQHVAQMRIVAGIVRKPFLTEMDLLRLRSALLMARMSADSTYLVDKRRPSYSTKLDRLFEMLTSLFAEAGRKTVLFSEWTTMLDEIETWLRANRHGYGRLDGKIPQGKRAKILGAFQRQVEQRVLLMTNAGSVGLNLQFANTVVNVDLPWNPAILEQRIGRVHRMGQTRAVQVFVLVTEGTIEEGLLETLGRKQRLADAALDVESELDQIEMAASGDDLKRRLEKLLGHLPDAAEDRSELTRTRAAVPTLRERIAKTAHTLPDGRVRLELTSEDAQALQALLARHSDGSTTPAALAAGS